MSSPAFSFALPGGTGLVDGEIGIGRSAGGLVAGFGTCYFARHFELAPGLYQIKLWAMHAATLYVGTDQNTSRRVFDATSIGGTAQGAFYVYEGEKRFSVILAHLDSASTVCGFAFSLWRAGRLIYKTDNPGWFYEGLGGPVADADIATTDDARLALPVFTLRPNWNDGITERVMYLTDIAQSEEGEELRRAIRTLPRRAFEASFLRHGQLRSRLNNMLVGLGKKPLLLPLWHEQYRVRVAIPAATTGVSLPADSVVDREFRVGDLVLIENGDPNKYDVVKIAALNVGTGAITWAAAPRAWPTGARITPLRVARIVDDTSLTNLTDAVGKTQILFDVLEGDDLFVDPADDPATVALSAPSWGNCAPLFQFQPNRSTDVVMSYSRIAFTRDNQVGVPNYEDPSDQAWIGQRFTLLLRGREEVFRFRRFVAKARGRAVRFYMPSFTNDVQPVANTVGGAYVDAKPAGLYAFTKNGQHARHMLAFVFRDGSPTIYRTVTQVEETLDGFNNVESERIHITPDLPPMSMAGVKRIEWITTSRFDQDTFELHHYADESVAVGAAIVTRLVDDTAMEPIDCWITSRPYPAVIMETTRVTATISSAHFDTMSLPAERLSSDTAMGSASLRDVLVTYTPHSENVALDAGVGSGSIADVLVTESMVPEELASSATVDSGSLATGLVTYNNFAPEGLDPSCVIGSGTLA